jgi:hypothetical protein
LALDFLQNWVEVTHPNLAPTSLAPTSLALTSLALTSLALANPVLNGFSDATFF